MRKHVVHCLHSENGWCLVCVQALADRMHELLAANRSFPTRLGDAILRAEELYRGIPCMSQADLQGHNEKVMSLVAYPLSPAELQERAEAEDFESQIALDRAFWKQRNAENPNT